MKKLITIYFKHLLSRLHNGEHCDFFAYKIILLLTAAVARVPQLSAVFLALQAAFQREDELYKKSEAAYSTPAIARHVEMLRAYFGHFKNSVEVLRFSLDPSELQAIDRLRFLINTYVDILSANYSDLSALAGNFLKDCDNATNKPSVELLELQSQVTRLKNTHTSFLTLYNARFLDKEQLAELGKLRYIRVEVDIAFEVLIDGVNVAWTTNEIGAKDPDVREALLECKEVINGAIHQTQLNLAHRGVHHVVSPSGPQNPDINLPDAPDTPPQTPDATPPTIDPDELNPPAVGER
ncbi:MAG: DUF6261 family protein [Tannerellaceae bacterium]|jgi:hypothetical protein|nr:DUF6261 family protein [Tannerellaceae bacterium]